MTFDSFNSSVVQDIIQKFPDSVLDLFNELKERILSTNFNDIYELLFFSRHYPVFFIFHAFWICICVRKFNSNFKWMKSFLLSFFMVLFGRVCTAYFTDRLPVILENTGYITYTILIWFLVNCSPFDFVYRLIKNGFFALIFQIIMGIIQTREICHGYLIGLRAFPNSATGSIIIPIILSSTESLIWLLFCAEHRSFGMRVVLRNILLSSAYYVLFTYPELLKQYIIYDITVPILRISILAVIEIIVFLDTIFFGFKLSKGLDITFLTYLTYIFTFKGN